MSATVTFSPVVGGDGLRPVTVLLGAASPVASNVGGWAIVNRPKNVGFTSWDGFTPSDMNIQVMFDGFANDLSQQADYDALVSIMRSRVGPAKQPSPVRISGPVPGTSTVWVIQSVSPDSSSIIRRPGDGTLLRIAADVSLIEYVEADVVITTVVPSPAQRVNETIAAPAASRTHTVVRGDTLSGIAVKYLGSWARYKEIAALNGIRDPNRVAIGTVLKIP